MNYLAHLFLSCDNEDLLIGNFIADSITNSELGQYPPEIQEGVYLHRKIDTYTDQHPLVRQGARRLRLHHGKYAPVVIDVLYDYLLANHWERYSGTSLPDFAQNVYRIFTKRMSEMPPRLQHSLPKMIAHDWLNNYKTEAGMRFTLSKMDERTRFPSNFADGLKHLMADYDLFAEEFNAFFPEVIAYVDLQCKC